MPTRTNALAVAALVAAAGCGSMDAARPPRGDLSSGQLSSPPTPAYSGACAHPEALTLIRSEPEWQQTWSALFACTSPVPAVPPVDFDRETLALAALGPRTSGGYWVAIRSAAVDVAGVLRVHVTEYRPGSGCVVIQTITYPVAVARLPHFDGAFAFDHDVQFVDCD